jgi:hypothetical protein
MSLRSTAPGDLVIMDNLSSRKAPKMRAMIEVAGTELRYLPALTSTQLKWPSRSSRPCGAKRPSAPSAASGRNRPLLRSISAAGVPKLLQCRWV